MIAWPSPISMTPAFSPGPQITRGPSIGNFFSWFLDDLYEQCSDHITENTPSSTRLGSRPRRSRTTPYSSALRPNSRAVSAIDFVGAGELLMGGPSSVDRGIPLYSRNIKGGSRMGISIKRAETEALAREVAAVTGESLTEAIHQALVEKVARLSEPYALSDAEEA